MLAQLLTRLSLALHGSLHQRQLRSASGNTRSHPLSEAEQAAKQEGLLPSSSHTLAAVLVVCRMQLAVKQSPCMQSQPICPSHAATSPNPTSAGHSMPRPLSCQLSHLATSTLNPSSPISIMRPCQDQVLGCDCHIWKWAG